MSIQGQVSPLNISVFPSDLCATVFIPPQKGLPDSQVRTGLPSLLSLSTCPPSTDVHRSQEAQPAGHH